MKLYFRTKVQQDFKTVFAGFNRSLFEKLAPPFPRVKVIRFDGCRKGDLVEIEMHTGIATQRWTSLITESGENDYECYFVDEGQVLPAPLKFWRHKHIISKNDQKTFIYDQVEYRTASVMLDYMLYPVMYAQFLYRKPVYKSVFRLK